MASHGQHTNQQQQGSSQHPGSPSLPRIRDILAAELQGGSPGTSPGPQRTPLPPQNHAQVPQHLGLSAQYAARHGTPAPQYPGSQWPGPPPAQHQGYQAPYGAQPPYGVLVDASHAGGAYAQTPAQAQAAASMQPHRGVFKAAAPPPLQAAADDADSHTCPVCGRRFDRPSTMRIHLNSHTGDKPFTCSVCGRAYTCSSNLYRHQRRCDACAQGRSQPRR